MSVISFEFSPVGRAKPAAMPVVARAGFWTRLFDRFVEARQRSAMRELRRYHRFMLPRELEDAGWKIHERSEDSLPFAP